ncbi:winged helix-turn-helix transcriptional regulator [Bacillus sp. NEB1478]|nr:winged helix-turn-helix transcriptional regulator [Bacillus sp. NEB1478]WNB91083.1 winged helix-turn-helix transcriptional regulator [Bacillus sp. NEB1478]
MNDVNFLFSGSYNKVPPKVEYSLTDLGQTLMPILKQMHFRGTEHGNFK